VTSGGPYAKLFLARDELMQRGELVLTIPNPHRDDISTGKTPEEMLCV